MCATPPPLSLTAISTAIAPRIITKYFAGIGNTKYIMMGRFGKQQPIGQKQPVDGARRPDRRRVERTGRKRHHRGDEDRRNGGGHTDDAVVSKEGARSPQPLELGSEHPKREHVEQDVANSPVKEHVRHDLPDPSLEARRQPV